MREGIRTSLLSIACVVAVSTGAYAAASVRSVGGAGTYSSAASAATDTSSRAGSLRTGGFVRPTASVSTGSAAPSVAAPTATATTSTGTAKASGGSVATGGSTAAGRLASAPRLSVGKYIGTPTSISTRAGQTTSDMELRIDKLERDVSKLETDKQDGLNDSTYIYIDQDKDEVVLNLDKVRTDLDLDDGHVVEVDADNDEGIKAHYAGRDGESDSDWETVITWEELRGKLNLAEMNEQISVDLSALRTELLAKIATKLDKNQGTGNANRVMTVNAAGEVVPGEIVYSATETDDLLDTKVDIDQTVANAGKVLTVNAEGKVEPGKNLQNELDAKVNIVQGANKSGLALVVGDDGRVAATGDFYTRDPEHENLGALAYKDQIKNADIANGAAIERSKLADDIAGVLDWISWWNANVPSDGKYVLSVDENGNRAWFQVIVDGTETGSVIENPSANAGTGLSGGGTGNGGENNAGGDTENTGAQGNDYAPVDPSLNMPIEG